MADAHADARDTTVGGLLENHRDDGVGDREFVHCRCPQQIRGSGSPTSTFITRRPPNAVLTSTIPVASAETSPTTEARSQPGTPCNSSMARSAARSATTATNLPSF